jgi:glycosyltransferase involved in cell wall biosynthesis
MPTADSRSPLLSVITVTYNAGEFLEETMLSVLGQSEPDIEYVLVDGGSTDGTLEIIGKYADRIAPYISEPDQGIFNAMNKGISRARGRWINFMNAGDSFHDPDVVRDMKLAERSNRVLVYGDTFENGVVNPVRPLTDLKQGEIMAAHQSMFFHREVAGVERLLHDESYKYYGDYEVVLRLFRENPDWLEYVPRVVSNYQGGGYSAQISWQARRDKYNILLRHLGLMGVARGLLHRLIDGPSKPVGVAE